MKTINEFLSDLLSLDIRIWVDSEKLHYSAPTGSLTPALKTQLRERKSAIIEFLQKANFQTSLGLNPILPVSRDTDLPLSFAQQRGWFLEEREGKSAISNLSVKLKISGSLQVKVLEQSLREIVQRHEILRSNLKTINGQPIQVIAPTATLTMPLVDLRAALPCDSSDKVHSNVTLLPSPLAGELLCETQQEIEVQRLAKEEACRPFDLAQDLLLRVTLLQLEATEYVMLLTMHHIVSDGWSMGVLFRELNTLYQAFSHGEPPKLPELPIQYADFAVWQRQYLQAKALENELSYWKQQLKGAPTLLQLPTNRPRPTIQTFVGKTQTFVLSKTLTNSLHTLSQQTEVTLFMTLLAAFKTILFRYTGQEDILVGSPIANRHRIELEKLIGFFINTLVLRTNLSGNPSFRELLKQVRKVTVEAYSHQNLPFEKLVEELQLVRDLSYSPLFQVMFVLQNAISVKDIELPGLAVYPSRVDNDTSQFDLTLDLIEEESGLTGKLEYNTDLFDDTTIARLINHFQILLQGIVANPDQRLSDLPLLTTAEQQQFWEWNQTQVDDSNDVCIHQLFEDQVKQSPHAVAVVFEDQQLTYQELNQRANQLANYLKKLGVKPEVFVGICVERSLEMVVGILGILKAGGAYLPLDPTYPQDRLAFILSDARVSVLLTQKTLVAKFPEPKPPLVCLDADWTLITQEAEENLTDSPQAENLAYVIYTSGSTGAPKGVMIQHTSLVNYTKAAVVEYTLSKTNKIPAPKGDADAPKVATATLSCTDRILQFASISFDAAAEEIFPCLVSGATLVLRTDEMLSSISVFLETCRDWQLTVLDLPTAFWHQMVAELSASNLSIPDSVRLVIIGGEAAIPERLMTWQQRVDPRVRLVNSYGPTEATIVTTTCELSGFAAIETMKQRLSIGKAVSNARTYVLDPYLQPTPVGIPGELYIGGVGVARGYLNRPILTAERFIPDPFSEVSGSRLYKTGDLVCYRADGSLEFLDRLDNQVKVRGFRIELSEIETVLRQHPAVGETVVVVREDQPGDKRLVAYVVPNPEQAITIAQLRGVVDKALPAYMIPTAFVMLEALPLTPNGKVDRQSLPKPDLTRLQLESTLVAPSTPVEEILASIWAEVLDLEAVGIHDNFFELGGHSLLATRVTSQLRQVFQIELSLRSLFESPTIAGLAKHMEKATKAGLGLNAPPITPVPQTDALPLSFAQQRLWFLAQLEPDNLFYNIFGAVRLQGHLNQRALEQSFNEILYRHEVLRTTFKTVKGQPVAVVSPATPLHLPVIDISEIPRSQREANVRQLVLAEAQTPLALSISPLLRVKLLRLSESEHVVLLTMHHIASDGWSRSVLVRELAALYQAFCRDSEVSSLESEPASVSTSLSELPIQYADYAVWQRQWLQGEVLETQLSYWRQHLQGAPAVLELPTDHPRPARQTFRGRNCSFQLSPELSIALKTLSQQQGTTLFMVLLAVFKLLLSRYTGSEDIVVGSPIANRNRVELEGLIGCFVNTLVLRTQLSGNPTFRELLNRVREVTLGAYTHQDLPFEQLVEELKPQRYLSHTPLFQVMFVLQNTPKAEIELSGLALSSLEFDSDSAKFDLTLFLEETASGLIGNFEYNTDLFEAATINRMAGHLQRLLCEVVANPDCHLLELPLLTQAEQQQLLVEWNNTQAKYPQTVCIHQLFEAQVERSPNEIAVVFEDQQLTYRELNDQANQLAHHLRLLGVGTEILVGIYVERSLEMVVGLLGILKAGAAYVPLDPSYPQERLAFILSDAQISILLSQQKLLDGLPQHQAQVICLDTDWETIEQNSPDNPVSNTRAENLAYVIYTSGSTGKPKGVQIPHAAAVNFLTSMERQPGLTKTDTLLAVTSISFDIAALELYLPLIVGARLVLVNREAAMDAKQLMALLLASAATVMQATPATWRMLLMAGWQGSPALKILCGGEALAQDLAEQLLEKADCVWNLYGPTETTIWSTVYKVEATQLSKSFIPIGCPIANTQLYLLDSLGQPVPIHIPGELHIGGDGLARGYLNRPELTAEKFIPNPFSEQPGTRLYKTGDLARYCQSGELEFLGRIDHQVKIRGFRIELGEIEATLARFPDVLTTVVVAREDQLGEQRLVAYVVPRQESDISPSTLRHFLMEKLPDYMVPATIVMLEKLPLTPNGKVDRRALPAPDLSRSDVGFVAPRTPTEEVLAAIYAEVLGLEKVGIDDNFFELGGHSLLATQVISRLREAFKMELPLRSLFEKPTVALMSDRIATMRLALTQISRPTVAVAKGRKEIEL